MLFEVSTDKVLQIVSFNPDFSGSDANVVVKLKRSSCVIGVFRACHIVTIKQTLGKGMSSFVHF